MHTAWVSEPNLNWKTNEFQARKLNLKPHKTWLRLNKLKFVTASVCYKLNSALCCFGEESEFVTRRERSPSTDYYAETKTKKRNYLCLHDWINWTNKLTLKDNTISFSFTLFMCGGPCRPSIYKQWGHDFPLRTACVSSCQKDKYYSVILQISKFGFWNFFSESTSCPFSVWSCNR